MTAQKHSIQPPETPEINAFLLCKTPQEWVEKALDNLDILLIDHAQCEKKAAAAAMSLMHRHVERTELLKKMSQLAREELLHFEQVVNILQERNIPYQSLGPARYAEGLRKAMRTDEHGRFIDLLIVGGIIEARSCERFVALIPHLDTSLGKYYRSLIKSEARHFEDYLNLAALYEAEKPGKQPLTQRINKLLEVEQQLILSPDTLFRFHSGVPSEQ